MKMKDLYTPGIVLMILDIFSLFTLKYTWNSALEFKYLITT